MDSYEGLRGWLYVIVLISYNLGDLIPTIIFLQSFEVYSKFFRDDKDSDSHDDLSFHLNDAAED
jgi:hypothetical protein